jgi:hypothetical protein
MRIVIAYGMIMIVAVWALQSPRPIPPFEGDGNSQHDGQPKFCQNSDTGGYVANCRCKPSSMEDCGKKAPECDGDGNCTGESPRCSVYCRPKACRCSSYCDRTK